MRSQRQHYLDNWLTGVSARLSVSTVALLEASIAEADDQTGFNTMRGDAGQASLDNILSMTAKLAVIQKLDLPRDILSATGKGGEIATNRIDEQEISALALHLLQASLVYVNTCMLQTVLVEPKWAGRMTEEDYRGLTPLIYSHVNPYGRFDLDLNSRIDFGRLAA